MHVIGVAFAFLFISTVADAQILRGHGGGQTYPTRSAACEFARNQAESSADAQVRWQKRNNDQDYSANFADLGPNQDCLNCRELTVIAGQPSVYSCIVRWSLHTIR
jgi:hypothetical protein